MSETVICANCGAKIKDSQLVCENCHQARWKMIIPYYAGAAACLAVILYSSGRKDDLFQCISGIAALAGAVMLLTAIIASLQSLRRKTIYTPPHAPTPLIRQTTPSVPSSRPVSPTATPAARPAPATAAVSVHTASYGVMCSEINEAQKEAGQLKNASSQALQSVFLPVNLRKTLDYVCHPDGTSREIALDYVLKNKSVEFRLLLVRILGAAQQPGTLSALAYLAEHDPAIDEREVPDPMNAQLDYYDREREKFYPVREAAQREMRKK